jgi:pseudaminic acid synthase
MSNSIKIGKKIIGEKKPCFIVAEISANHNGKFADAIKLIKEAKKSGADAVKIQTYTPDTITLDSKNKDFLISKKSPWSKYGNLYNLYKFAHTPWKWHKKMKQTANKIGIELFSSPFDLTAVDFLTKLKMNIYKVASPEINDLELLKKIAKTKKPVILSSGLADFKQLKNSVSFLKKNKCKDIILLKCLTSYPAPKNESNLKTMVDMKKKFNCLVGISDHSLGYDIPCISVAMGAKVIEKHFKLNNNLKTPDSFFSLNPKEFSKMVKEIRNIETVMGNINYDLSDSSKKNIHSLRSIYVSKNIKKGEKFTLKNTKSVRPGFSLNPKDYNKILGKNSSKKFIVGDRIKLNDAY